MVNISYFYDLLESVGNRHPLTICRFIFHAHASMYRFTAQLAMLMLACLTGVNGLVVYLCQCSNPNP